jgi:acyl-CoA thioester hydrolase
MAGETGLTLTHDVVRPEWVDYNGHLRDAYYLLLFSLASDALLDRIGLDADARTARGRSVYTLEVHLNYLRELKEGTPVRVDARVLAFDAKRMHVYFTLHDARDGALSAASEQMLLCVDVTAGAKSAAFDADVASRVAALHAQQEGLGAPDYAGRVIGLPERR